VVAHGATSQAYDPVTLLKLHSIELGGCEVMGGLIMSIQSPPGVAVGFWAMDDWRGVLSFEVSFCHVMKAINVESIILAKTSRWYLFCFEGPEGSLETTFSYSLYKEPFGPDSWFMSLDFLQL
jgi:hypothetical protein